ncbi:hypothetical protein T484DRAFT_1848561 [Baffinella frigidus]|nr:hypothetical protein T484DRAFT_1848561 [Cryptophyta sp. CCMP2293]
MGSSDTDTLQEMTRSFTPNPTKTKVTGAVKCWGYNGYGMLGYGDSQARGVTAGQMGVHSRRAPN